MVLLAVGATTDCAPGVREATYTVADSLGVSVIEYRPSFAIAGGRRWSTELEPMLQIGDRAVEFHQVLTAAYQSDGGIVVASTGTSELLLFDGAGRPRTRVGGEGGGPGEFRYLTSATVGTGDSLYAYDHRERRLSVFDRDGRIARAVPLRGLDTLGNVQEFGLLRTGEPVVGFGRRTAGEGLVRDSLLVVLFRSTGEPAAVLGVFPDTYTHWGPHPHPGGAGAITAPLPVPFSSLVAMAVRGGSIYIGLPDRYAILRLDRAGVRRITRQLELPRPITDEDRERLFALLPERMVQRAGPELDIMRGVRGPATWPAFGAEPLTATYEAAMLVTDADGFWLRPFPLADSANVWPRFDAAGLYEGTVTLPARFRATAVRGDVVLGVYRDSEEVEFVRAYRLIPDR